MKTMMKKTAAYLLALLLVLQIVPAFADPATYSGTYIQKNVNYREMLEITPENDFDIIKVGATNQLSVSSDYSDIVWESDDPGIATVSETGLVEAVAAGKVTIKVTAEGGKYKDTISFKIIAETKAEEPKTEPEAKPEGTGDGQEEEQVQEETIIIFIKGEKTKVEYNGQVQKNTYTVTTSNDALFDESKLTMIEDHLGAESNCGVWQDTMSEDDFSYDGKAEIVVSNGWINIKPIGIEIKADDITIEEGETPVYTASAVNGLIEGDTLDLSGITFNTLEQNGETWIRPDISEGAIIGNYRISKVISGKLSVNKNEYMPLYNLARLDGSKDYYRLAKTRIKTTFTDLTKKYGKVLTADEYQVEDYDFEDLVISDKNIDYVFQCEKNAELIADGANYYTVKFEKIEVCKAKIGAMNGTTPRWWVPKEQRYEDPNATDSIHRNYIIKTYINTKAYIEQEAFNMLTFTGTGNYYRLRKTTIKAADAKGLTHGTVISASNYYMKPYDFTDLVLEQDGVQYKYSDHELEGEYDSYYTIQLERVIKEDKVNNKDDWYKNSEGFLDGSESDYEGKPNNVEGYHANYRAYLHEGTRKQTEVTVKVTSSLAGIEKVFTGTEITLTATVTGCGDNYDLQWQYEDPAQPGVLHDIAGETRNTYTFRLDARNCKFIYYATVTVK